MSLKIPGPTLLVDPRTTRYYEEMMFYSWLENNVGPEFKGIRVFPPGFDDKEVWLWHNDAFEMVNHWGPNNNATFSRNPQMFTADMHIYKTRDKTDGREKPRAVVAPVVEQINDRLGPLEHDAPVDPDPKVALSNV